MVKYFNCDDIDVLKCELKLRRFFTQKTRRSLLNSNYFADMCYLDFKVSFLKTAGNQTSSIITFDQFDISA